MDEKQERLDKRPWWEQAKQQCSELAKAYTVLTGICDTKFIKLENFKPKSKTLKNLCQVYSQAKCYSSRSLSHVCDDLLKFRCSCLRSREEIRLIVSVIQRLLFPHVSLSFAEQALQAADKIRTEVGQQLYTLARELDDLELQNLLHKYKCNLSPEELETICDCKKKEMKICNILTTKQAKCDKDPLAIVDMLLKNQYYTALSTFLRECLFGKRMSYINLICQQITFHIEMSNKKYQKVWYVLLHCMNSLGYILPCEDLALYDSDSQQLSDNKQLIVALQEICAIQSQPQSLQHWCRISIRRAITGGTCVSTAVGTLPLPDVMKQYLMMDEYRVEHHGIVMSSFASLFQIFRRHLDEDYTWGRTNLADIYNLLLCHQPGSRESQSPHHPRVSSYRADNCLQLISRHDHSKTVRLSLERKSQFYKTRENRKSAQVTWKFHR